MSNDFWQRIDVIAPHIGAKPKTVWAWKNRDNKVPAAHHFLLLQEAKRLNVPLTHEELANQ